MVFRVFSFLILCIGFCQSRALAKEVDQFTDRLFQIQNLKDASVELDAKMNAILKSVEKKLNANLETNRKTTDKIFFEAFQSQLLTEFRTPFEYWVRDKADVLLYWVGDRGIYGGDVDYDDMGMAWYIEISPVIKIGSFLVGIDKLGHFLGQGWFYYKEYKKLKEENPGWSEPHLYDEVLKYGNMLESTYLGLTGSGVYSHGDLAANAQGFLFFRTLLDGYRSYFKYKEGQPNQRKYVQVREFHFLDYVTDDWDEVINPSKLRSEEFHKKVTRHVEQVACKDYLASPEKFMNRTGKVLPLKRYLWSGVINNKDHDQNRIEIERICLDFSRSIN